jgi:hypothetical protein
VIGVLSLAVAVVLPLLPRDRELPCARHLKQIGTALLLYARENNHRYPATLAPLFTGRDPLLDQASLKCPAAAGSDISSSCVYVGNGMTDAESDETVVAYDPNHREDGIYVLYGDGHVTFLDRSQADYLIAEVTAGHNPPRPRGEATSQPSTRSTGEEGSSAVQSRTSEVE